MDDQHALNVRRSAETEIDRLDAEPLTIQTYQWSFRLLEGLVKDDIRGLAATLDEIAKA